ncbi:hypothetical protein [Cupriavidus sp. 8B]
MKQHTFLESAMRMASDAATRQLSGKLVMGLEAVSGTELAALAEQDNGPGSVFSALQIRVSTPESARNGRRDRRYVRQ